MIFHADGIQDGNITWLVPVAPLTGSITTFSDKCLDVPNGSTENGVKLQIWTCAEGNTNQMFQNHIGQIEWSGTGKCIDLTNGNSTSGNPVRWLFLSWLFLSSFPILRAAR
ncbi:hypothetical protein DFH07DRAFT_234705 [Mycena maculata]|uniref:Ricin B lectin domain-containing protein n=1 Tax=Mycena maculata TaxID=230809 RepID=A0AAD7HRR7_9AGAR|nr:hypothetical protein DFH07DRAFT_234705 [Mycena maculata]